MRVVVEGDQHLVERDLVEDVMAGIGQDAGHAGGVPAAALDQVGEAVAAEERQRRPDVHAACAA